MLPSMLLLALVFVVIYYICFRSNRLSLKKLGHPYHHGKWQLSQIRRLLQSAPVPIIHEDAIRQNTDTIFSIASSHKKKLRVATKSIRIPELIELITSLGSHEPLLMCYSVKEAEFLIHWSEQKHKKNVFKDILIAYPTANRRDVELAYKLNASGPKVTLMVDSLAHIEIIAEVADQMSVEAPGTKIPVCVDVDASLRLFWGFLHLGAHRSPCHTAEMFEALALSIMGHSNVMRLAGVMTYEAQIAGVGDSNIHNSRIFNWAIRMMKRISRESVTKLRQDIKRVLREHRLEIDFFNGGGTGNLDEAASDANLTEVAAGSGFLQPELFDYYVDNVCSPAMAIALQVTRIQKSEFDPNTKAEISEVVCCQSGGFIASGPPSRDKVPSVFLPRGLEPFEDEGFGEVQTPLQVSDELRRLELGPKLSDFILIRPAKSGEIAERFPKYLMVNAETSDPSQIKILTTYRGYGKSFF